MEVLFDAPSEPSANARPVANAGSDREVPAGQLVVLDGRGSSDPEGQPLNHRWEAPPGVILDEPSEATQELILDEAGIYRFYLTVDDGEANSDPDEVVVVVTQVVEISYGSRFMLIPEDGRFLDLEGDVDLEPIDIIEATFAVTEDQILATITVSFLPDEATFNSPEHVE